MSKEDIAPEMLSGDDAHKYIGNVLLPLAHRIGGDSWGYVSQDCKIGNGDGAEVVGFSADRLEDNWGVKFGISIRNQQPIDGDWEESVVRNLLGVTIAEKTLEYEAEDSEFKIYFDENGDEVEDAEFAVAEAYRGTLETEKSFHFILESVIGGGHAQLATVSKSKFLNFLDEDGEIVDSEVVYHLSMHDGVGSVGVETAHASEGKPLYFNETEQEAAFGAVTKADLVQITKALRRVGLLV